MEYYIRILGLKPDKRIGNNPYSENYPKEEVIYDTKIGLLGIMYISADNKYDALVKVVKLCAEYYDIFKSHKNDIGHKGSLINESTIQINNIPKYILEYYGQRQIFGNITDFQSLQFEVIED